MSDPTITHEEWLAELERLQAEAGRGDEGQTVREMMSALGMSRCTSSVERFRERMGEWISSGLLVPGRGRRMSIDGSERSVPVYRFVRKEPHDPR